MDTYWFCKSCPHASECSPQAWKRAQVWGWTQSEAQASLVKHLTASGLHGVEEDLAVTLAELAEYEEAEAPPQKRPRVDHGQGKGFQGWGKDPPGQAPIGAPVSSSLVSMSSSAMQPSNTGTITLRREQLASAVDALSRAYTSARAAQRLLII